MHITQAYHEAIKIKSYREKFKRGNKRGSVNFYIQENGGIERILRVFCGINGFCSALKDAGYDAKYIYKIKNKLKNRGKNGKF